MKGAFSIPSVYLGTINADSWKYFIVQNIEVHDVMYGVVSAMQESGIIITLLAFDGDKARDSDNLKIQVCGYELQYKGLTFAGFL